MSFSYRLFKVELCHVELLAANCWYIHNPTVTVVATLHIIVKHLSKNTVMLP